MLNAPQGTVKSRLHYGRKRLKIQLEEEAEI
jgi:DNA-directed RNA polymerase specialized sigma24 family protein